MTHWPKRTVAIVASVIVLLSGCSSSGNGNSTASAGEGGDASSGAQLAGDPIVIGGICSCSGIAAPSNGLSRDVAKAWVKYVNAHGGVNGHPVKFIIEDDTSTPSNALQVARKLVEQDKVVAIVGENSLEDDAWGPYVASKGVPVVGGLPNTSQFLSNADFFPNGAQFPVQKIGEFTALVQAGIKKYGQLYCAEAPVCAQFTTLSKLASALTGDTISVSGAAVSATAPNYISQCESLKARGTDAVSIGANGTVVQRIASDCYTNGFRPQYVGEMPATSPAFLTSPGLDGAIFASPDANYVDESIPAIKTMDDALDRYAPGVRKSANYSYDSLYPWFGGQLFLAAAKSAHLSPTSTAADVKAGLYALKGETLGGLAPPLTYNKGKPTIIGCYFVVQIKSGKFVSSEGTGPKCLTAAQQTGLVSALAKAGK